MNRDEEQRSFKRMLTVAFAFLVLTWYAWPELKFAARGRTVEAQIVGLSEKQRSRRGVGFTPYLEIYYQFTDPNGVTRQESDDVPIDWRRPASGKVLVQYIPGALKESRLNLNRNEALLSVFVALIAAGWMSYRHWKKVRDANVADRAGRSTFP